MYKIEVMLYIPLKNQRSGIQLMLQMHRKQSFVILNFFNNKFKHWDLA